MDSMSSVPAGRVLCKSPMQCEQGLHSHLTLHNEASVDPRPNKALEPVWLDILLHGYRHQDLVVAVATRGVAHKLNSPRPPDGNHVRNHTSTRKYTQALIRSVSDGQASGTYLVLELSTALRWSELRFSPFGCVPKKDVDPLSKHGLSMTCQYESVRRLAEKIEVLVRQYPQLQVKVLKGDVKSAFGLIPVDAKLAAHFAGSCGGLAIVDMTLPFGWTGLPAHYGAFGGAISFLVARESPKSLDPIEQDDESFFSFVWVDDHILLEVDRGNRLALAETALRLSMIATLGPKSINEKKFSSWSTRLVALGLTCDTQRRTISIPADKVHKALNRISDALSHPTVSRHQVEKLLRSLRYLAICCRSTRAFLQRLHQLWRRSSRFQSIRLPQDARHDLRWVASLLQNGAANRVATSIMADTLEPAVHLFMDASNEGIAVLYPAAREYIRLQFDEEERLGMKLPTSGSTSWFSINVREALSAVLSVLVWGPQWQATCRPKDRPLHVRCWIDNASAVAWLGDHNTKTPAGQELTRVLYCAELSFNLHVTSKHLEGSSNYLCGSRIKSVDWANSNSTKMDQSC
ncbi:hypothetical protein F444_21595 [Phytophthora nicotianae P1976]|uniref:Reverse transcriptase domain-containing protein n=1 Tax=Phytophthora nicotianae P1976 TaxID=1317066 RepID=A0A080Z0L1_PHYNI|nr:hypothetical protein F444_21595 [Phytophthora nicotianae P1976]